MLSTWIEASARGRLGGPVRAGMWSGVVVGTNPIETDQQVWLELQADERVLGPFPAFWLENRGFNSLWHIPIPPQRVNARLRYRAVARRAGSEPAYSPFQEVVVRANQPSMSDPPMGAIYGPEGLVGNREMTIRVDERGCTFDIYFPTVGLHSDVRPKHGDEFRSRVHFRAIVGGLANGDRIDWFSERRAWKSSQSYRGATNLLVTELQWRDGPVRVQITDLAVLGVKLPRTVEGIPSPGQYIKRFRLFNDSDAPRATHFGIFVQAEVNGGVGDPGLLWQDGDLTLLAANRGHGHANRKLARDATVEFGIALDDRGPVVCETSGIHEAMLLRSVELPPRGSVAIDMLVSGAFTGWMADTGTYEHCVRPAIEWFRSQDLDQIEQVTAQSWERFAAVVPTLDLAEPAYDALLRRSALAAALHCDAEWGAVAAGFDRGIEAYCWPRVALFVGEALGRAGHPEIPQRVFEWLGKARKREGAHAYWFQKYTIDGSPEWETPSVDQTALIPWALERHYRRTGDREMLAGFWPLVEQAALVCEGRSAHPGLRFLDDLDLLYSAGVWDTRFGAFLYSNACVVAGLRAAARLAAVLDRGEPIDRWQALAGRILERGILGQGRSDGGLIDPQSGRFLESRRQSILHGMWTDQPELRVEHSSGIDISLLGPSVPLELLPADDPHVRGVAEAILASSTSTTTSGNVLASWSPDSAQGDYRLAPTSMFRHDPSSLSTLWMVRYLLALGRESGDPAAWVRAVTLLEGLRSHLGPLGQSIRLDGSCTDVATLRPMQMPGAWRLHALVIETLLDLAGLDYDVPDRELTVRTALPPGWPRVGLTQQFPCGEVTAGLERPTGGFAYKLSLRGRLLHPVTARIALTCPGLRELGSWQAHPPAPPPEFQAIRGRLAWSVELPQGPFERTWSWGRAAG